MFTSLKVSAQVAATSVLAKNPQPRLHRHNIGQSPATRSGRPSILLYRESFLTRPEAVRKERYFKSGRGRDELDTIEAQLLEPSGRRGDRSEVQILSPRPN